MPARTKYSLKEYIEFNSIPEPNTGCWLWLKSADPSGYGHATYHTVIDKAHRFSFRAFNGALSAGEFVCHKCDTPACVNPDHLFKGDALVNTRDMMKKGRHVSANKLKLVCKHGHDFTPENTLIFGRHRKCYICTLDRSRRYERKKRAEKKNASKNLDSTSSV